MTRTKNVEDASGIAGNKSTITKYPQERSRSLKDPNRYLWIIDNGHGKFQKGKRASHPHLNIEFREWYWNRQVSNRLVVLLDEAGIANTLLVPEHDVGSFLSGRIARANAIESELPKILVSIHANWTSNAAIFGTETWFYTNSTSSRKVAHVFQEMLASHSKFPSRGCRCFKDPKRSFKILRETHMPAILTECGFYSNEEEVQFLVSDKGINEMVKAHFDAIKKIEKVGIDEIIIDQPVQIIA